MEIKSLDQSCNLCDASTQSAKQVLKFGLVVIAVLTALAAVIDAREEIGNSISVAWRSVQLMVTFGGDFWGALATSAFAFVVLLWAIATFWRLNASCKKYEQKFLIFIALAFTLLFFNASNVVVKYPYDLLNTYQATAWLAIALAKLVTLGGCFLSLGLFLDASDSPQAKVQNTIDRRQRDIEEYVAQKIKEAK